MENSVTPVKPATIVKPPQPPQAQPIKEKIQVEGAKAQDAQPEAAVVAPSLQGALEQFIEMKELNDPSSHFTVEGICKKCGWHTLQLRAEDAKQLLRQHVQTHWRSVMPQVQR